MRKLLALLLAVLLLSAPMARAWAEEGDTPAEPPASESVPAPEETPAPAEEPVPPETDGETEPADEENDPADSAEPEDPDQPADPAEPEDPDQPADPAEPEDPDQPEDPAEPEDPDQPEDPAEPEDPDQPEDPAEPEDPDQPEDPDRDSAAQEDPQAEETGEGEQNSPRRPLREKSLAYWEEEERPAIALTGDLREDILIIARSQIGYSADSTCYRKDESGRKRYYTRYGEWFGMTFSDWCDMFVSFCVRNAGAESYPAEASCMRHMFRLKQAGYWREWNSYVPQKGDIVFFRFDQEDPLPSHVGLVEEVVPGTGDEPGSLITIEGNMANPDGPTPCVRRTTRSLDSVVGYGTYESGPVYPAECTIRFNGWTVIGPDSVYFVESPTEEAMRFLGLYGTPYYEFWFPKEPERPEEAPLPEKEPAVLPKKALKPERRKDRELLEHLD